MTDGRPMQLTATDLKKLWLVHPDLLLVVLLAAKTTTISFTVLETARTLEQQKLNVKKGVSWTLNSRHLPSKDGLCRAVDIAPIDDKGQPIWAWPVYFKLAPIIKTSAAKVGIAVEWGGDWKKAPDGPHWQLNWKDYP